jgi:hypothetical protein
MVDDQKDAVFIQWTEGSLDKVMCDVECVMCRETTYCKLQIAYLGVSRQVVCLGTGEYTLELCDKHSGIERCQILVRR